MPDEPTGQTVRTATTTATGGDPTGRGCCASRRQVLRAGGIAALAPAAAGALAGCGGGSGSEATVGEDGTVTVPAEDTAVGGATYYADPKVVVTHPTQDDYRAYDATCPHQGCAVSGFEDGLIVCPCHGSQFDPATGDVVRGPAQTGLTPLTAAVEGGDLVIRG